MDEWSSAEPRPLSFPLRESIVLHSTTPDDATPSGVFVWPDDPDEKTVVLFELSQREYTALSSTIDVGRDIAYGVDSVRLWWLWIRNMIQVPSICAMMIDCIMNDADVRDALTNAVLENDAFRTVIDAVKGSGNPITPTDRATAIVTGACDEDLAYGIGRAIVTAMDTANTDLLEKVEAGTNAGERATLLYGAIPLLETLPFDEVIELGDQVTENFIENYAAEMDEEFKHEIACAIKCMILEHPSCEITFDQLFNYFSDQLGSEVSTDTLFRQGVAYIASGTWIGDQVVWAMMLTNVVSWRWTGSFLGVSLPSIATIARTAEPLEGGEDCGCEAPPEPRYPLVNGDTGVFPSQTMTFMSYDGAWDVWEIMSAAFVAAPFTGSNGVTYTNGFNLGMTGGVAFNIEDLDGMDWMQSYDGSTFPQGAHFNPLTSYLQVGGFTTAPRVVTVRVKTV